jgi:hypothetical protein
MTKSAAVLALAPLALVASLVFADDSMGRVTPTDHQLLKECMERQKTNANVTVSKAEAKRYCKDELKRQKATGATPERAPVDTPHAPADSTPPSAVPPADAPPPRESPPG